MPQIADQERRGKFVKLVSCGITPRQAAIKAGYAPSDASNAVERMLDDPLVREEAFKALTRVAVTWNHLVSSAKYALAFNLDPRNWVNEDGKETVKASDRNNAAKIVLDALRGIDRETLSEKAVKEDTEDAIGIARQVLNTHETPALGEGTHGGTDSGPS
jgi:hypothetical protein